MIARCTAEVDYGGLDFHCGKPKPEPKCMLCSVGGHFPPKAKRQGVVASVTQAAADDDDDVQKFFSSSLKVESCSPKSSSLRLFPRTNSTFGGVLFILCPTKLMQLSLADLSSAPISSTFDFVVTGIL